MRYTSLTFGLIGAWLLVVTILIPFMQWGKSGDSLLATTITGIAMVGCFLISWKARKK